MTGLAAMLAVTSAMADGSQADWIKAVRASYPTADLSQDGLREKLNDSDYESGLEQFAEADAIVYFQDHKDIEKNDRYTIGTAHAFKHHLIAYDANTYSLFFAEALEALLTKE